MTNKLTCLPIKFGVGSKFTPAQKFNLANDGNFKALYSTRVQGFIGGQSVEVVDDDIRVDQVTHQFQPSRAVIR